MHFFQTVLNSQYPMITRLCLQVIGKYIQWIDINLVANDRFVPVLVSNLCNHEIRESAADCIQEVVSKGMDPIDKTKLVQSFSRVLADAGIWLAFVVRILSLMIRSYIGICCILCV